MRLVILLGLLVVSLAVVEAGIRNRTTLRKSLKSRKKSIKTKKKETEKPIAESKSASHPFPIVVTPIEGLHPEAVPIRLNLRESDWQELPVRHYFEDSPVRIADDGHYHNHHRQHLDNRLHDEYEHVAKSESDYRPEGSEVLRGHDHPHSYQDITYDDQGDLSAIPGVPGVDYPTYTELPKTHFKCLAHTSTPGFYADVDTRCQVWHYCQPDGRHDRFLCPNGTIFDQQTRVCNWWYNVHCESSLSMYDMNFDLYRDPPKLHHAEIIHRAQPSIKEHVPEVEEVLPVIPDNHYSHHGLSVEPPEFPTFVKETDYHHSAGASPLIYKDKRPSEIFPTPQSEVEYRHRDTGKNAEPHEPDHHLYHHPEPDHHPHHHEPDHYHHHEPEHLHHHHHPEADSHQYIREELNHAEPLYKKKGKSRNGKPLKKKRFKVYRRPIAPTTTTTTETIPTYRERIASPLASSRKRVEGVVKRRGRTFRIQNIE